MSGAAASGDASGRKTPLFWELVLHLRARRVPVGATEFMTLMRAIGMCLHDASLTGFYHLARSILIHTESHFDAYDDAFKATFAGVPSEALRITDELLEWLADPKKFPLSAEQLAKIRELGLEDLIREFEERLR